MTCRDKKKRDLEREEMREPSLDGSACGQLRCSRAPGALEPHGNDLLRCVQTGEVSV